MACSVLGGGSEGRRIGSELKYRKKNCMHRHVQAVSHCNALFDSQLGCRPPFYHIAGDVDCICVQLNCVLSRFAVTCAHTHTHRHTCKQGSTFTHTHVSAFAFALFSLDAMSEIRKGKKEQEVEEENATCTEEVQQNRLKQLKLKRKHTL